MENSNQTNGFGSADIDAGQASGPKWFKLRAPNPQKGEETVELILRLLPSMHSYRDTGQWAFYYGQHFGHFGTNPKFPDKPRARPFGCVKKSKGREVEVRCPKCDQIDAMMARKDKLENELASKLGIEDKKSPEFYEAKKKSDKLNQLSDWLKRNNCDRKVWINVMSYDGQFGVLQVSYSFFKDALKPYLRELQEKSGIDAFSPTAGVWLRFTSTGKAPRLVQKVEKYVKDVEVDGEILSKTQRSLMSDADIQRALKTCPDLAKNAVKWLTVEQIQQLLDGDDSPEFVDSVWGVAKSEHKASAPASGGKVVIGGEDEEPEDDLPTDFGAVSKPPVPEQDDEEAELERRLAEKRASRRPSASAAADFISKLGPKA